MAKLLKDKSEETTIFITATDLKRKPTQYIVDLLDEYDRVFVSLGRDGVVEIKRHNL
jgi:hypothetical protein